MYGLFDTVDRLWMGNGGGPLTYEDEQVAEVAAMICDRSLHQLMGRTRAIRYIPSPVSFRDSKPILTDPATALGQLEDGF